MKDDVDFTDIQHGPRLEVIRDSALLAMGSTATAKIGGLIVPDSAHIEASDAVVAAIKQYAFLGGQVMLVYDAGALTDLSFYPLNGNSRFAGGGIYNQAATVTLDNCIISNNSAQYGSSAGFAPPATGWALSPSRSKMRAVISS